MLWAVLGIAFLVVAFGLVTPNRAEAQSDPSIVVGFDDYPANISGSPSAPSITDQYRDRGLTFTFGVTALVFNSESFPPRPDLPRSGDTVISSCYAAEFCSARFTMAFDPPLAEFTTYAGYYAGLGIDADLILEGYDEGGEVIARDTVTMGAADEPIPATNRLSVADPDGRIVAAQVRWADETQYLGRLIIDDVTLTPFVPVAELTTTPSPIELKLDGDESEARVDVKVSNTGNVPLFDLFITLDDVEQLADETRTRYALNYDQYCFEFLEPDQSCAVEILATPGPDGTVDGSGTATLTIRGSSGAPAATTPVRIAVTAPTPDPIQPTTTTTTTEDTTTTTTEDTTTTTTEDTTTSTEDTTISTSGDGEDPVEEIIGGVILVLLLVGFGAALRWLVQRGRSRTPPPPPPPPPGPRPDAEPTRAPVRPSLGVRGDPGTQTIDQPTHAGPTLVAQLNGGTATVTIIDQAEGALQ